jgi:hypothetical protein
MLFCQQRFGFDEGVPLDRRSFAVGANLFCCRLRAVPDLPNFCPEVVRLDSAPEGRIKKTDDKSVVIQGGGAKVNSLNLELVDGVENSPWRLRIDHGLDHELELASLGFLDGAGGLELGKFVDPEPQLGWVLAVLTELFLEEGHSRCHVVFA